MPDRSQEDQRQPLLRLLPMSGSPAGPSVGAVTLCALTDKGPRPSTFADDLLCAIPALDLPDPQGPAQP